MTVCDKAAAVLGLLHSKRSKVMLLALLWDLIVSQFFPPPLKVIWCNLLSVLVKYLSHIVVDRITQSLS